MSSRSPRRRRSRSGSRSITSLNGSSPNMSDSSSLEQRYFRESNAQDSNSPEPYFPNESDIYDAPDPYFPNESDLYVSTTLDFSVLDANSADFHELLDVTLDLDELSELEPMDAMRRFLDVIGFDNVHSRDELGRNVLTMLVFLNEPPTYLMRLAIEQGVDINSRDDEAGMTPLMYACYYGRDDAAMFLIDQEALLNSVSSLNQTALMIAILSRNFDITTTLLEEGASVNIADANGLTPLMAAAILGADFMVNDLLDYGADITISDPDGNNALMYAIHPGDITNIETIVALSGYENGNFDINRPNINGETPLMLAVGYGDISRVRALLDHPRINVNFQNEDGVTALMVSTNAESTSALLEHPGIDVNLQHARDGETATFYALRADDQRILPTLLRHPDVDLVTEDIEGHTILMLAVIRNNVDAVRVILEYTNPEDLFLPSSLHGLSVMQMVQVNPIIQQLVLDRSRLRETIQQVAEFRNIPDDISNHIYSFLRR